MKAPVPRYQQVQLFAVRKCATQLFSHPRAMRKPHSPFAHTQVRLLARATVKLIYAMAAPYLTQAGLRPKPALYSSGCKPDAAKL